MEIFRKQYSMDADRLQLTMAFIGLPWDFKILYGVITDTVRLPCFESFVRAPRRAYIMLFAFLQAIFLIFAGLFSTNA